MSLKEAALAAAKQESKTQKDKVRKDREASLDAVREGWGNHWRGWEPVPDLPEREEFTWATLPSHYRGHSSLNGWRFTIDGISFVYSTTYGQTGLLVILTCPDCGAENCDHFHSLQDLGQRLQRGAAIGHHCLESEASRVAYAIGAAARDAKTSPEAIINEAMTKYRDVLYRALG